VILLSVLYDLLLDELSVVWLVLEKFTRNMKGGIGNAGQLREGILSPLLSNAAAVVRMHDRSDYQKVAAKTVKSQMLRGARALSVRQSYAKCPN
jgi:hypothetical protein